MQVDMPSQGSRCTQHTISAGSSMSVGRPASSQTQDKPPDEMQGRQARQEKSSAGDSRKRGKEQTTKAPVAVSVHPSNNNS